MSPTPTASPATAALRDRVLAGNRPYREFVLAGSGTTVHLRRPTYAEVERLMAHRADDPADKGRRAVRMAAVLMGDVSNGRLFDDSDADLDAIAAAVPFDDLAALVDAGMRLVFPGKQQEEAAGKRSAAETPPT